MFSYESLIDDTQKKVSDDFNVKNHTFFLISHCEPLQYDTNYEKCQAG